MAASMTIAPLTEDRFPDFVRLIQALAAYESLPAPDASALDRLRADAFGPRPRFEAAFAVDDARQAVGYAIWFETYSSFLARPTMYLEDLFVLEQARGSGAGRLLFEHVHTLGRERGCGRMDWQVLDWNAPAREFYARMGARWLQDWLTYRIEY
jgi:GNAT superfamily N-acetyltransferase